jgi:hypothetical protein
MRVLPISFEQTMLRLKRATMRSLPLYIFKSDKCYKLLHTAATFRKVWSSVIPIPSVKFKIALNDQLQTLFSRHNPVPDSLFTTFLTLHFILPSLKNLFRSRETHIRSIPLTLRGSIWRMTNRKILEVWIRCQDRQDSETNSNVTTDVSGVLEPINMASSPTNMFPKRPSNRSSSPQGETHPETQPMGKHTRPLLALEQQKTYLHGQANILAGRGSKEQAGTSPWSTSPRLSRWRNLKRWIARPSIRPMKRLRKKLIKRLQNIANDPAVDGERREAAQQLLKKVEVMEMEMLNYLLHTVQEAIKMDIQRQTSRFREPPTNDQILHSIIIDRPSNDPRHTSSSKLHIVLDEAYQYGWVMVSRKTLDRLGVGFTPLKPGAVTFQGGMEGDLVYSAIGVANSFRFRIEGVPSDGRTFESAPHPSRTDGLPEDGTVPFYVYEEEPRRAPFMCGERAIAHLRLRQHPNFSTGTHMVQTFEASKNASAAEAQQDRAGKAEDEKSTKKGETEKERRRREHDARKS